MRKKYKILIVIILLLIAAFVPFIINYGGQGYTLSQGELFYNGKPVENFNMSEYKYFSRDLVKDSSNVHYRNKPLDWIDATSFKSLGNDIYADKNALYCENNGILMLHKLMPMKKNKDKETFRAIGGYLYKDENGIYVSNNDPHDWFGSYNNPLKKVSLPELDTSAIMFYKFENFPNIHWHSDGKHIYFATYGKLEMCPEIDAETFRGVEFRLFCDKNNVYFLRQYLRSETIYRSTSPKYAILQGADGSTFKKVNTKEHYFEDKNSKWKIELVNMGKSGHEHVIYKIDDENDDW